VQSEIHYFKRKFLQLKNKVLAGKKKKKKEIHTEEEK
jgi:hypothetical protein